MVRFFKRLSYATLFFFLLINEAYSLIAPVRTSANNHVILISSEEIRLVTEHIDLYHHPLGIWIIEYNATLENRRVHEVSQQVSFPAGYDMRMIEGDLYCDRFENFKVYIDNKQVQNINTMLKCSNYVDATGMKWSMDDGSGIGFLNTWKMDFQPEQIRKIRVTFTFVITKPPQIYDPTNKESWYVDSMNWLKVDYAMRDENQFRLPISLGSFWALYPDSITIRTYVAKDWLKMVKKNDRHYDDKFIKQYQYSEPFGFYSPPEVARVSPTQAELEKMSRTELILLKSSFVAKYGRIFKNPQLKMFFRHQPWYFENPKYHNWYLTDWDVENIKLIHAFEKSLK